MATANRLREYRMKAVMTQGELAKMLGIAQPVLSRIERGRGNPSLELAARIARVLDKRIEDIFLFQEYPKMDTDKRAS
ncbi:MAG: helix-turn-helix transcriptional regulator [Chloroflexi bacterium]|nr:helix-turn-helix transcriptional regulator [Chloroflexota bacterium]MDA8188065.1 helix-turn-helix transcriptional regulator [Dehalococcoidales bacterium]